MDEPENRMFSGVIFSAASDIFYQKSNERLFIEKKQYICDSFRKSQSIDNQ